MAVIEMREARSLSTCRLQQKPSSPSAASGRTHACLSCSCGRLSQVRALPRQRCRGRASLRGEEAKARSSELFHVAAQVYRGDCEVAVRVDGRGPVRRASCLPLSLLRRCAEASSWTGTTNSRLAASTHLGSHLLQ